MTLNMHVIKETIDSNTIIKYKSNAVDDLHMRKPNISKAKELLIWEHKIPLNDEIRF